MIYNSKLNKSTWVIISLILTALIFLIDMISGYELAFALFYLLPVAIAAWFIGRIPGILISILCALGWLYADILSGHPYSHVAFLYWNSAIRFCIFLIVALLISALKKAHAYEKELARTDNLTGAVNARYFHTLLSMEILRFERKKQAFTIAYIDVDNFKSVNDHQGHSVGDKALTSIVNLAKNELRRVDIVARLGGDEFAFLLPDTDQNNAKEVLEKIRTHLLKVMNINDWPLTFSIGAVTCTKKPASTDQLIMLADQLMYTAKHSGKNTILYSVYGDEKTDG